MEKIINPTYDQVLSRVRAKYPTWNVSPEDVRKIHEILKSFRYEGEQDQDPDLGFYPFDGIESGYLEQAREGKNGN